MISLPLSIVMATAVALTSSVPLPASDNANGAPIASELGRQVLERGCRANGMPTKRQEVPHPDHVLLRKDIEHIGSHDCGRHRCVTRCQRFGNGHDVWHEPEVLAREHFPGAAEPIDDLVGNQQHAMAITDLSQHLPVGR